MRLRDIRIGYKILILVVVGFIGMTVLGFTGYRAMVQAGDDLDNLYSRKLTATRLLGNEINYMRMIQVRIVKHILDPQDEKIRASIDEAVASYEQTWPEYRALGMRADAAAREIPTTESKWDEYKSGIKHTESLVAEGKTEEAWTYYKGVEAGVTQQLLGSLVALQKVADDNAAVLNSDIQDRNAFEMWLMGIATVVCFALLLGFSYFIIREITQSLHAMIAECELMQAGDFRESGARVMRGDELGQMADAMHGMRESLGRLMATVSNSAEQLAASSEELTASAGQAAEASTQVAQSASEVVNNVESQQQAVAKSDAAVQNATRSVDQIKIESDKVAANAITAAEHAARGSIAIDESVSEMQSVADTVKASAIVVDRLGERSKEIGAIVDTISTIAEQTSLLALNAAIEAARAGEHGRGFTVVAEEVGKLASESQDSAKKIAELIAAIQDDTASAVDSMKDGREAVVKGSRSVESLRTMFEDINSVVGDVSAQIQNVTAAIDVMASDTASIAQEMDSINESSEQVASEMQSVSAATEEQSASAEEIASASDALAKLAQDQQEALAHFKF